jgi:hypothetical protein
VKGSSSFLFVSRFSVSLLRRACRFAFFCLLSQQGLDAAAPAIYTPSVLFKINFGLADDGRRG